MGSLTRQHRRRDQKRQLLVQGTKVAALGLPGYEPFSSKIRLESAFAPNKHGKLARKNFCRAFADMVRGLQKLSNA